MKTPEWIVLGEEKGKIQLISKKNENGGILPNGSYLTVEDGDKKFILRVDRSDQTNHYAPSPLLADFQLPPLLSDQESKNTIFATRVKDLSQRRDGLIDFVKPQLIARRSTREEINEAMGNHEKGIPLFLASVHNYTNQVLTDENAKPVYVNMPEDVFFHQIMICGKTGSGKTVASKYLAQYFVEKMHGAVVAINVKDIDFLQMERASNITNDQINLEWDTLDEEAHGINNCCIYYPATMKAEVSNTKGVNSDIIEGVTIHTKELKPEALVGLLQNITNIGTMNLPDIFRYWQKKKHGERFHDFVQYFESNREDLHFKTLNANDEEGDVTLHKGTFDNIKRNLDAASTFFDKQDAKNLKAKDILQPNNISILHVATTNNNSIIFGSVVLRQILHQIIEEKTQNKTEIPVLIIIDEVHQFYNSESTKDALGDLDTICRTGRSKQIGLIFSSQNPSDLPKGLSTVINTKFVFRSDNAALKSINSKISDVEIENLDRGYAAAQIHDLSQVKFVKFPLSFAGVLRKEIK